ncbi:MAG: oxidoreductase [Chitinophaga sp.]|nr:oxidoreductase [Chitinophaga sp.]
MKKINTALLSFGMSGRVFHAPFIHLHEGFELLGSWERSNKTIQQNYPSVKSYNSLEAILNDDAVELVIVNTPTYTHFEYAEKALQAGKHIVVEKAFTTTVAEAEALKALAIKQNKQISVFQNRRWDSDFKTVKKIINSKVLGDLNEVEIHFDRYNLALSPKTHKEIPSGGAGILKDLGPHLIDQALCLFGMPEAIFADIRITRKISAVDDCIMLLLYYPTCRVTLKAGYIIKEALPSYIIHGTEGSFIKQRADVQETQLQQGLHPDVIGYGIESDETKGLLHTNTVKEYVATEKGNYYDYYDGVYKSLTENIPMPVTVDDGINVMKIIEAAIVSNEQKKQIALV